MTIIKSIPQRSLQTAFLALGSKDVPNTEDATQVKWSLVERLGGEKKINFFLDPSWWWAVQGSR